MLTRLGRDEDDEVTADCDGADDFLTVGNRVDILRGGCDGSKMSSEIFPCRSSTPTIVRL